MTFVQGLSRCTTRIILDSEMHRFLIITAVKFVATLGKLVLFSAVLPNIHVYSFFYSRSLNELRVLLLESHRHSRDMEKDLNREVHKAEWRVKEQKLQDDIKTLREKLLLLVRKMGVCTTFQ